MVLRDRDMSNGWTGAADGTLEERLYTCQNWRADVVALVEYDGGTTLAEWAKYSAYGIPFGMPVGDTDSDGDQDATDVSQVQTWIGVPTYDVRGDTDLDGDLDEDDVEFLENIGGASLGRGALSTSALSGGVGNRKGYAGYDFDANVGTKYHVRHRVLDVALGRWLERDELAYVDGVGLYQYGQALPTLTVDPSGMWPPIPQDACALEVMICLLENSPTFQVIYAAMTLFPGHSTMSTGSPGVSGGVTNAEFEATEDGGEPRETGNSESTYVPGDAPNLAHESFHALCSQAYAGRTEKESDDAFPKEEEAADEVQKQVNAETKQRCDKLCPP